jgi:hypothetical protein
MDCEARALEPMTTQAFDERDRGRPGEPVQLTPAMQAAALDRLCRREADLDTDVTGFVDRVRSVD